MKNKGFTLIELMIAVAIVGVLSMIALPSYRDYVMRGQLAEGRERAEDFRLRVTQAFQTPRSYTGAGGSCVVPNPLNSSYFSFVCVPTGGGTGFLITATGLATSSVPGFLYTTDDGNARTSTVPGSAPSHWQLLPAGNAAWPASCWIRSAGKC